MSHQSRCHAAQAGRRSRPKYVHLESIIPALIAVSWRNFVDVAIAPSTFLSRCYGIKAPVADATRATFEWDHAYRLNFPYSQQVIDASGGWQRAVAVTAATNSSLKNQHLPSREASAAVHFSVEIVIGIKYVAIAGSGAKVNSKRLSVCRFRPRTECQRCAPPPGAPEHEGAAREREDKLTCRR
jgi:hypothetical protein